MACKIVETPDFKFLRSEDFNYNFDKRNGYTELWGKTKNDDPDYCKFGPVICDIEISDGNSCAESCPFCYKGNSKKGSAAADKSRNMSIDTFKQIFAKLPKTVTQIAFGITSVNANPDMFAIYDYCRENGVIPNMTISGSDPVTDEQVERIVKTCGAIAVSIYSHHPQNIRYNLLKRLIKAGLKQTNIHFMISKQTISTAYEICNDLISDPELSGVNAIVFLGLKPKNRGQAFDVLSIDDFNKLVTHCLDNKVPFGFDSCSAAAFEHAVTHNSNLDEEQKKQIISYSERCESGIQSLYINVIGEYWHCSFSEDLPNEYCKSVIEADDFVKDIWMSEPMQQWRERLYNLKRECPLYPDIRIENR